jgi:hypothetical protein
MRLETRSMNGLELSGKAYPAKNRVSNPRIINQKLKPLMKITEYYQSYNTPPPPAGGYLLTLQVSDRHRNFRFGVSCKR